MSAKGSESLETFMPKCVEHFDLDSLRDSFKDIPDPDEFLRLIVSNIHGDGICCELLRKDCILNFDV